MFTCPESDTEHYEADTALRYEADCKAAMESSDDEEEPNFSPEEGSGSRSRFSIHQAQEEVRIIDVVGDSSCC